MRSTRPSAYLLTVLLAIGVWSIAVCQQEQSLSTIPLVDAGGLTRNSNTDFTDTPEYERLKEIYDNLVEARGDFRYPVPTLQLKDQTGYVASIDYADNIITFEKKAYDVCAAIGDEAIAFLLGHELTHFYEKHAWKRGFVQANTDIPIGRELKKIQDGVAYETEADYLGGFLAYSAGYGLFDKGDEVISDLYTEYGLGEQLDGYPSKTDRIELSKRSARKLKDLVALFEMANYSYAVGAYNEAYDYYKYILLQYQTRELHNNMGVLKLTIALEDIGAKNLVYKYPTELDLRLRGSKGNTDETNTLLLEAVRHFNAAINMDPEYAPAYLNKAIAYAAANDLVKARFYLDQEARPIANAQADEYAKTMADIHILDAILLDKEGKKTKARSILTTIKNNGSAIAAYNLDRVNGLPILTAGSSTRLKVSSERIGSMSVEDYLDDPYVDHAIKLADDCTFFRHAPADKKSTFYLSYIEDSRDLYRGFQITADDYQGQTQKNIKIGSSLADVTSAYGTADNILGSVRGEMLIYDSVIFIIEDGKVTKWITYDKVRD